MRAERRIIQIVLKLPVLCDVEVSMQAPCEGDEWEDRQAEIHSIVLAQEHGDSTPNVSSLDGCEYEEIDRIAREEFKETSTCFMANRKLRNTSE